MTVRRTGLLAVTIWLLSAAVTAQSPASKRGARSIDAPSLKEWLAYIASDELQGREVYTEGLGLAASYIARHLGEWGVKPAGEDGSFFQTVKVLGVRNTGRSSITVEVNGRSRTFAEGEGFELPKNVGGKRTFAAEDVLFVGYGWPAFDGENEPRPPQVGGRVVVWLGPNGPRNGAADSFRSFIARTRSPIDAGALGVIHPPYRSDARPRRPQAAVGPENAEDVDAPQPPARAGGRSDPADFITTERFDGPRPPSVTAQEEFFEFLLSGSDVPYADLKGLVARGEPLPVFALKNVRLTFNLAPEYSIVSTRLTRNIVGIVEGTDERLKNTYVTFGAHYDHIGYVTSPRGSGFDNFGCPGQSRPEPRAGDIINNGADDDGSGTVALMAIARAFALGPRPKRSLMFVWHTAEENGLLGSRYNADHSPVPPDNILAQLNVDMIGRNRCDHADQSNTVYLIGSDRISTELHNVSEDVNASMPRPLTLDYELNDPDDPQALYTRSDHYSYAAKGIPVIFYTTGLHRDYHYLTDEIGKIEWGKLTRVTQLLYATGQRLANLDRAPARDNKGPRVGKGDGGKLR